MSTISLSTRGLGTIAKVRLGIADLVIVAQDAAEEPFVEGLQLAGDLMEADPLGASSQQRCLISVAGTRVPLRTYLNVPARSCLARNCRLFVKASPQPRVPHSGELPTSSNDRRTTSRHVVSPVSFMGACCLTASDESPRYSRRGYPAYRRGCHRNRPVPG